MSFFLAGAILIISISYYLVGNLTDNNNAVDDTTLDRIGTPASTPVQMVDRVQQSSQLVEEPAPSMVQIKGVGDYDNDYVDPDDISGLIVENQSIEHNIGEYIDPVSEAVYIIERSSFEISIGEYIPVTEYESTFITLIEEEDKLQNIGRYISVEDYLQIIVDDEGIIEIGKPLPSLNESINN